MPDSRTNHTGTGAQTQFSVSFPFLARAHVSVTVDEVSTAFTWVDDSNIDISPAPADQAAVEIRRTTPDGIVAFSNGSSLPEEDLNTAVLLAQYQTEEAADEQAADDTDATTRLTAAEGRLTVNEAELVSQDGRLDALEAFNLDARLDTLESATLDPRVTTLEGEMDAAEGRLDDLETDYNDLLTSVTTLAATIITNGTGVGLNTNAINAAEARIDDLEAVNADRFSVRGTGVAQTYNHGDPAEDIVFAATPLLDPDGGWDGTSEFTIPVGSGGLWHFTAIVAHDAGVTEGETFRLDLNFSDGQQVRTIYTVPEADSNTVVVSGTVFLAEGVRCRVRIVSSGVGAGIFRTSTGVNDMTFNGFRVGD